MTRGALVGLGRTFDALGEGTDLIANRLCLGRQLDGLGSGDAATRQTGHVDRGSLGVEVAEQHGGAPHEQMGVVLPRDRDAAVHLRVEIRTQIGGGTGEGGGDRGGI